MGSAGQLETLNGYLGGGATGGGRVVVIGGGPVGCQVARALGARGAPVRIVERDPELRDALEEVTKEVLIGDVTDRRVIRRAGIRNVEAIHRAEPELRRGDRVLFVGTTARRDEFKRVFK